MAYPFELPDLDTSYNTSSAKQPSGYIVRPVALSDEMIFCLINLPYESGKVGLLLADLQDH